MVTNGGPAGARGILALPPATFHILLALADGELHGYAIMKGVTARSEGGVRLGPGTLYGALKRLLDAGLVGRWRAADPERGDERRPLLPPDTARPVRGAR